MVPGARRSRAVCATLAARCRQRTSNPGVDSPRRGRVESSISATAIRCVSRPTSCVAKFAVAASSCTASTGSIRVRWCVSPRIARGGGLHQSLDQPTTVHWHGIRLANRFDGVPHLTQPPVPPGGSFRYRLNFPDAGVFWYHPHHREDLQQDLGTLRPAARSLARPGVLRPGAPRRSSMLDDLLLDDRDSFPSALTARPTH